LNARGEAPVGKAGGIEKKNPRKMPLQRAHPARCRVYGNKKTSEKKNPKARGGEKNNP